MKMSNRGGVGLEMDRSNSGMKKGPWSAAEDAMLMEYVKKHGEGNWNAVQKNSGLMRCGKSCRLRWANHLRPNLKKGSFTPHEEKIIIQLHAKLGNKWARMAAQLPGRTDNEIKNYWNTRMKRRQRAGLPIYPQNAPDDHIDIDGGVSTAFVLQQQQQQEQILRKQPSSNSPLISSTNFLISSPHDHQDYISQLNSPSAGKNQAIPSFYNSRTASNNNYNTGTGFCFSLSPAAATSPIFASSSSNLYNQFPQFNSAGSLEQTLSYSTDEPINSSCVQGMTTSSNIIPPVTSSCYTTSGTAAGSTVSTVVVADSGNTSSYCEVPNGSSGLLDALLLESISLSRSNKRNKDDQIIDKGKDINMDAANINVDGNKYINVEKHEYYSSHQLSMAVKPSEDSIEDDDLLSLLNNFPSSMPLPEWYTNTTRRSNGNGSSLSASASGNGNGNGIGITETDSNMVLDAPKKVSQGPATGNIDRALMGSCCWKNMPGIC